MPEKCDCCDRESYALTITDDYKKVCSKVCEFIIGFKPEFHKQMLQKVYGK